MSYRFHIQTKQPEYKGACVSAYEADLIKSFLIEKGIDLQDNESDTQWEIPVTDGLRTLTAELEAGKYKDELETSEDHACLVENLAAFLRSGLDAAEANGYSFIVADCF